MGIVIGLGVLGCSSQAAPRAQLVIVLDTDAPTVSQAENDPALSLDAAIDTLRIDFLKGADEKPLELVAPDDRDWPISFGVVAERKGSVRLRVRAYRGSRVDAGHVLDQGIADPPAPVTIDRVAEIELDPSAGVKTVRITLHLACMGVGPDFVDRHTCIDENARAVPWTKGIETLDNAHVASHAGSSPLAREVPCQGTPPKGAVCIPGGFTLLGDPIADGLAADVFVDPVPQRPAVLSPFFMDKLEMTVGRYRALMSKVGGTPPSTGGDCTFSSTADPARDQLPLNCVSWKTAAATCADLGGSLPTEAQWEHAARGRGQGRRYVWGDEAPSCCSASIAKLAGCSLTGIEQVGSHTNPDSCGGTDDVSRDGVDDLAGSVSEDTLDAPKPYDDSCWGDTGPQRDPTCTAASGVSHVTRGGNWASGSLAVLAAARAYAFAPEGIGFRCVYRAKP